MTKDFQIYFAETLYYGGEIYRRRHPTLGEAMSKLLKKKPSCAFRQLEGTRVAGL